MQEVSLELSIGDAVQIGDQILIVVDINDDEIRMVLNGVDPNEINDDQSAGFNDRGKFPPGKRGVRRIAILIPLLNSPLFPMFPA